ncbi:MAG: glycosyltransferase [Gammaproteobacteria bacterium]
MNKLNPKVSIGLPVFNGEKYLKKCLDSLLSQTFKDFEIIISDNCSTDATEDICHDYIKLDSRVRYHRNNQNLGASENFNITFKLSKGIYFKWAAYDDVCAPRFLDECVRILDCKPDVVLVHSRTKFIDSFDQDIGFYNGIPKTNSIDPVVRFADLLLGNPCYEVFGLIRYDILKKTPLMGDYANGDGVLLSRLAMLGRFEEINEYLFMSRRHDEQSISMLNDFRKYSIWFNPKLRGNILFPHWKMQMEFARSINNSNPDTIQKYKCYKHLYWNSLINKEKLIKDIKNQANEIKRTYFSKTLDRYI